MVKRCSYFHAATILCVSLAVPPLSQGQAKKLAINKTPLLPISFETNRGQIQPGIDFVARTNAYSIYLSARGATLRLNDPGAGPDVQKNVEAEIDFVGANRRSEAQPEVVLSGYSNFLFGSDPDKWITGVTQYARVRYKDVYPGIDIVYHGKQDHLEHDFVVLPGADPQQVAICFTGANRVRLDARGELLFSVGTAEFRLQKPHAYQRIGGNEADVKAEYVLHKGQVHFRLGRYHRDRTLIIDPVLIYSTFLGGGFSSSGAFQSVTGIAADMAGNLYVSGVTTAADFPVTPGVIGPTPAASFVSKIDPAGTSLIYSTYIAGMPSAGSFAGAGLAVDASGAVYIAGAGGVGLPIPASSTPYQAAPGSLAVLKLNATGTAVLAGTYLGASTSSHDVLGGMAVDNVGSVFLTGTTSSVDFPTQNALQATLGTSGTNAFVTKLNPAMSGLVYSTYLGQNIETNANSIALDPSGNAYIVGSAAAGFPTTTGAFQTNAPLGGPFLAKLNPAGSSVLYATYIAGSGVAEMGGAGSADAVAVDASLNIWISGRNFSLDFPAVTPVQSCSGGGSTFAAPFLSEISPMGALIFSTCLGNDSTGPNTSPSRIALDGQGKVYISGTSDGSLPLVNPIESHPVGTFLSELDPVTHTLFFSTFLGQQTALCCDGSGDHVTAIAVDKDENIYAAGWSSTLIHDTVNNFPIFNALQPLFGVPQENCVERIGCYYVDAMIMKVSLASGAAGAVSPSQLNFPVGQLGRPSGPASVTVHDLGTSPLTVSNVTATGDFSQTNNCGVVAPSGGTCSIAVTFTPRGLGNSSGTLTIVDNSAGSPRTVPLTGRGGEGFATPSPATVSFPSTLVGQQSSTQPLVVKNAGSVDVQVASVGITGPFSVEGPDGCSIVPAGSECDFNVFFAPTAAGPATGAITISDTGADSPQTIALTGTGITGFAISATSAASATVSAGATATFSLAVGSDSAFSGSVQFNCTGAPAASSCMVSPNPLSLSASSVGAISVTVSTTTRVIARSAVSTQEQVTPARPSGSLSAIYSLLMLGAIFATALPFGGRAGSRWEFVVGFMLFFISMLAIACGGGGGTHVTGTPSGTYIIVVTGTSGSNTQSLKLTLTVQ
jgi:Beta-propeller repeat